MELENSILTLSRKLLVNVDTAHKKFQYSKEKGIRGDFYSEVKPFADEVKIAADAWRESAAKWVRDNRPKNLHANQIETAADYLEVISVQAFFPETSKKRFLDQLQSVEFILNSMIIAIEEDSGQPGS
ncbi:MULTISPECIES: YppE family protein [unclassified Bacillus (in: firmicutes)]|uniref:YppE family protein n=1 Tax=unclassified Bacillus (in: firmicutes) TaxID=185979 RepID=UPI001BE904A1|nr:MULTISPECIES: YppE family protein [unclassified Bacillus (in: firmicutes)]MBT2639063.1 YppE family protein [Bacillus sp. ISL-39]MBT2662328.1 YppE family protein [Bacillus sp. ISL-45]